jgi:endonuclease/exonuclease/phosphatase family metal-dependent hydrolase
VLSRLSLVTLNLFLLVACTTVEKQQRTIYSTNIEADKTIAIQQAYPDSVLRVATLNLAHGRKDSFNQLFVLEDAFKENLSDIANVLRDYWPHVVALQEADTDSRWSGGFDHVEYLASAAGYPWRTHESNAESWLFSYGTALLSALPLTKTIKHTFEPSPPTLNKGFVLAQIDLFSDDENKSRKIDILSVHLDFSRQSVRDQQINEMLEILSVRKNPTIIMGDFNSEWLAEISVIKELATKSHFISYRPESPDFNTYKNKRLDWILITNDLEFVNYQVLPETLSDHAMVIADIRFKR